jgi:DNA repair exonuclease SbcCD ATPase subunit
MLTSKLVKYLISFSLLGMMTSASFGQTLYSERSKLNALKQEQKGLIETNSDIEQNLESIKEELTEIKSTAPSDNAYDEAKANLAATEETLATDPSSANQAKVDNAKFKLLLAERKYKKNNKELFDLEKEQQQLSASLVSNNRRSEEISGQVVNLTAIVGSLQANKAKNAKAAAEAKSKQQQLDSEREIAQLREKLAQREAEAKAAAVAELAEQEAQAKAEAAAAQQALAAGQIASPAIVEYQQVFVAGDKAAASRAMAAYDAGASEQGKKGRSSKIINIKNYRNGNLVNQSSKSLKNSGNRHYKTKVQLRTGVIAFIVGSTRLEGIIESSEDRVMFIALLDSRDMSKATMTLIPTELLK